MLVVVITLVASVVCLDTVMVAAPDSADGPADVSELKPTFEMLVRQFDGQKWELYPWIDFGAFEAPADHIASRFGTAALGFLKTQAKTNRSFQRQLALLTLAKLGEDPTATQTLSELLVPGANRLDWDVLLAVSYMPISRARWLLERQLQRLPIQAYRVVVPIGHLLTVVGDAKSLTVVETLLKRAQEKEGEFGPVLWELNQSVDSLRDRLALPPDERTRRLNQERLFWRALNEGPIQHQNIDVAYQWIPARLKEQGIELSDRFLVEVIERGEPGQRSPDSRTRYSSGHMAMAILASQSPNTASRQLAKLVQSGGAKSQLARRVLSTMGPPEAARTLENLISPANDEEVNLQVARWLTRIGNHDALSVLERAAADSRFSAKQRRAFQVCHDELSSRFGE